MPADTLHTFTPIALDGLKDKAELTSRRDRKYVLSTDCLTRFLEYSRRDFDILEIDGKRQFSYASYYFDSKELHTHQDHNKGRRRRIKVRHRHYVDNDLHYLEVKLKGARNITQKYRMDVNPEELVQGDQLHPSFQEFCQNTLRQQGYDDWPYELKPSIVVYYDRITLVAKQGDQRITIDNGIAFSENQHLPRHYLNNNCWIVEVKSSTGRTEADRWLLRNRHRHTALCSKYGMGISILKTRHRQTRFDTVLRRQFSSSVKIKQDA